MKTSDRKRDRLVSASLIVGALLAGLAALAAQRKPPAPRPAAAPRAPAAADPGRAAASPSAVAPASDKQPVARPHVDLVFALDTTGSMSGLIEGAKRKIWSIASFVARAQPTPDLRVGLVAYRDIGDAYVTRVYDLDGDLDRVYRRLLSFRAAGGGDTPEHVAKALHEAVYAMSWTSNQADNAGGGAPVRLIYLVGDAPPHLDYHDGYDYAKAARTAAQRGIQVHAIRCGSDPETGTYWRRIASLGGGEFLTIDQDGGMRDRHTPYDDELARLHDELSDTVVPFGRAAAEAEEAVRVGKAAAPSVKAARAGYMAARKAAVGDEGDLVAATSSGAVDLDNLTEDLPRDLAALPAPERKAKIAEKAHARGEILDRIAATTKKREEYLSRDKSDGPAKGFDAEVETTVRKAGSAAGLKF
jgi:Mg-chelatase subunit ChlD